MQKAHAEVLQLNILDKLCKEILASSRLSIIEKKLRYLLNFYDVINYNLSYDRCYWRARKCVNNTGFDNINELGAPPASLTPAGRLNEPTNPMLYLSTNQFSILEEVACKPQDILHVVAYQQIPSTKLRCAILGEKVHVHRWGRAQLSEKLGTSLNRIMNEMSWDVGRSFVYTDAFLSSLLKDMNASNNEYIYSRTLTKLILEKHPDIDAIVYPGVALEGSMNFAIKPEIAHTKLKVESNFVIKINEKYDYGMYDFEIIKLACGHDFDGKIRWQET